MGNLLMQNRTKQITNNHKIKAIDVLISVIKHDPLRHTLWLPYVIMLCTVKRLIKPLVKENDIICSMQFGFGKGHSTLIARMLLTDRISKALYNGEYLLGVFLDFRKAFDTVNHEILLRKLYCYVIRGIAHDWLNSYLSCRSQYFLYEDAKSSQKTITCGVPQCSILGSLLFLLYINDMASVSNVLFSILFADDTNVFLSGNNADELIKIMSIEAY